MSEEMKTLTRAELFEKEAQASLESTHLTLSNPQDVKDTLYWQVRTAGKLTVQQLETELDQAKAQIFELRGLIIELHLQLTPASFVCRAEYEAVHQALSKLIR